MRHSWSASAACSSTDFVERKAPGSVCLRIRILIREAMLSGFGVGLFLLRDRLALSSSNFRCEVAFRFAAWWCLRTARSRTRSARWAPAAGDAHQSVIVRQRSMYDRRAASISSPLTAWRISWTSPSFRRCQHSPVHARSRRATIPTGKIPRTSPSLSRSSLTCLGSSARHPDFHPRRVTQVEPNPHPYGEAKACLCGRSRPFP